METELSKRIKVERKDIAENLIAGVQYLTNRDVLQDIADIDSLISLVTTRESDSNTIDWIKINQVGVCHDFTSHQYFTAIQKILYSLHLPGKTQLIYLIYGDGEKISLYIGVKRTEFSTGYGQEDNFTEYVSAYINDMLPGTSTCYIGSGDSDTFQMETLIKQKVFHNLYAVTGIPSLLGKDGEESLSTIDTLVGPLSRKKFVYYVVADPINEAAINRYLNFYLELTSKIETIKSATVSEGYTSTTTIGSSDGITESVSENKASAVNRKGKKHHKWAKFLCFMGLGEFVDQSTETISKGTTKGNSHQDTKSEAEGYSTNVSKTIVNKYAEHVANRLSKHSGRFEKGLGLGMWRTSAYLLTEDRFSGESASQHLKAVVSGNDSSLEPIRIHDLSYLLKSKDIGSEIRTSISECRSLSLSLRMKDNPTVPILNCFGDRHEDLTTILSTEELSCLINLPQKNVPGLSLVDYASGFSLTPQKANPDAIHIGKLIYSGQSSKIDVGIPIDTLSRHALVAGVNGSGKTNTVLSVLNGFMERKRPFLIIEPAKTEYVDWAIEYNIKHSGKPTSPIRIYMPGCKRYAKHNFTPQVLKINPFEVISLGKGSEPRVLSHIDRLKSTFAAAFPMQDILPVVMEHLLYDLYTSTNPMLDESDPLYMKKGFPTLSTVDRDFIKDLMRNIGYAQENTQNISAALRTRFESLKFGWKGEMLNNPSITGTTWSGLFGEPCIINLSYAGDDQDRAFMMSLMLQFLYEYRIAESECNDFSFNANTCRHLVVVEEAHRVMSRCESPDLPQYKSGLMFSNFLSEVRAYGQGMMIVDQVPSRLIEDAIKNTNIKVIHKLVAADDAERIAECIGLSAEEKRIIPKLSIGQAILAGLNSGDVSSLNSSDIYLAQIEKNK